jgi:hypothetical protein
MKKLYQTKVLAWIGSVVLISVLVFMLLSWLIPTFKAPEAEKQLYTIRHQELRDNNPLYTDLFLKSIKRNNGYLVLGTSESNTLPHGNYYDFLNADTTLPCKFSVVAGAGRTPCTYFPLIQSNGNIEGVKILFFINPRYWSDRLANSNKEYFDRYVSAVEYQRANRTKNGQVDDILKVNRKNATLSYRVGEWGYFVLDRARRKYYQDLIFDLNPKKFQKSLHHFWTRPGFDEYPNFGKVDSAAYDFRYNVALPVEPHLGALSVDTSITYRYDELHTMITLCREHCVDITFVIGPYNRIALQKTCPEEVANLETVCRNIKQLCRQEGVPYIDATDLSSRLGAFNDYQHHSSYGAYLIYQKIKEYVLEKENR